MCLAVLVLLLFSAFTIRSNSSSSHKESMEPDPDSSIRQSELTNAASRQPSVELEMTGMMEPGHVPSHKRVWNDTSSSEEDRRSKEEREKTVNLSKWKAAEIFKISVNYLQVIAVAVTVNVDWTDLLIEVFEAAGKTAFRAGHHKSVLRRDHWGGDIRSSHEIGRLPDF